MLQGREPKALRESLGLKKFSKKLSETFDVHCIDSWCLAYQAVGGAPIVDDWHLLGILPILIS